MSCISGDALIVTQDYHMFHLAYGSSEADPYTHLEAAVDAMIANDGIGQVDHVTVIASPHQNNFEMPLLVEVWSDEPPVDTAAWQEAFDFSADVDDAGVVFGSGDAGEHMIDVPPGRYNVRVVGRGFIAIGWPGTTTPGDTWRIQFWPRTRWTPPHRVARWEPVARASE